EFGHRAAMPGMRDEKARNCPIAFVHAAPGRIEVKTLGVYRARFGEGSVHSIRNRDNGIEIGGAHPAPAAGHDGDRNGAITAPVTRRGRPLALSSSAHIVRARTCTRPSSPVNSMKRSNFAPCGASATHVRAVTRPPGPRARR